MKNIDCVNEVMFDPFILAYQLTNIKDRPRLRGKYKKALISLPK